MKIAVLLRMVRAMQRSGALDLFPVGALAQTQTDRHRQLALATGFGSQAVWKQCRPFYAEKMGRPSLAPGQYFRLQLLGYFEGLDSERGIAWRAADSSGVRTFLGLALTEGAPDHSTISRTRRLIDLDTHRAVFTWVLQCLGLA